MSEEEEGAMRRVRSSKTEHRGAGGRHKKWGAVRARMRACVLKGSLRRKPVESWKPSTKGVARK